jgi:hypothetical protein
MTTPADTIDSFLDKASEFAIAIQPVIAFVKLTQKAIGLGGQPAEHIVAIVADAFAALQNAASGAASAEETKQRLAEINTRMDSGIAAGDAAADKRLADRFPES